MSGTNCVQCGNLLPENAKFCTACGTLTVPMSSSFAPPSNPAYAPPAYQATPSPSYQATAPAPTFTPPPSVPSNTGQEANTRYTKSVMRRYRDVYWSARFTVGIGQLVKLIGLLLGLGVGIGMNRWFDYSRAPQSPSDLISGVSGFIVFAFFFIVGVIVCAQGQKLKAELDSAVYASPFMTEDEKAKVMSL
jgi:hypothetical protein